MKRRGFLATLAALPLVDRRASNHGLDAWLPGARADPFAAFPVDMREAIRVQCDKVRRAQERISVPRFITVTVPGGARFTGELMPDGWVRVRDPYSPSGYVEVIQAGRGVDVRWSVRVYRFEQAKVHFT